MDLRRDGRKKLGRGTKLSLHVCGFELKVIFSNWPTCSSWILEEVGDSATWFHSVSNVKTRSPTVTFTWVPPSQSQEDSAPAGVDDSCQDMRGDEYCTYMKINGKCWTSWGKSYCRRTCQNCRTIQRGWLPKPFSQSLTSLQSAINLVVITSA